jgi:hypothetical protein
MTLSTRIPYPLFFSYVGYIIFSVFLAAAVVEVGATILRSALHWMHAVNAQSLASSPPYQGFRGHRRSGTKSFSGAPQRRRAITSLFISSLRPLQQQQNVEKTQNGDRSFEQEKPRFIELGNHESI